MKKITTKFLVRFLLISIIPILILGLTSSYFAKLEIENSIYSEMKVSVEHIGANIEQKFEKIEEEIFKLISDKSLQRALIEQNSLNSPSFSYPITDQMNSILFTHFGEYAYIDACVVFNTQDKMYPYIDKINCDMEEIIKQEWFIESKNISNKNYILSNKKIVNLYGQENERLALAFPITNLENNSPLEKLGYVFLVFSDSLYFESYSNIKESYKSTIHVYDNNNELLSYSDSDYIDMDLGQYILENENYNERASSLTYDDKNKIYICSYILPNYNYSIVKIIPRSSIAEKTSKIHILTIVTGAICIFLAIISAKIISRNITLPLLQLNDSMQTLEKGDFNSKVTVTSEDEIGQIQDRYNNMVVTIKNLFDQTVEDEKKKRIEELKALQYQINPHFLYNTLNSVRFMAMISKCENVSEMLETLIRLLRNVMGKMGTMVPVSEEISNVKDYIYIQNIRYAQNIKVIINTQEDIDRYLIPNFILQPIVENAIFHGIEPKKKSRENFYQYL